MSSSLLQLYCLCSYESAGSNGAARQLYGDVVASANADLGEQLCVRLCSWLILFGGVIGHRQLEFWLVPNNQACTYMNSCGLCLNLTQGWPNLLYDKLKTEFLPLNIWVRFWCRVFTQFTVKPQQHLEQIFLHCKSKATGVLSLLIMISKMFYITDFSFCEDKLNSPGANFLFTLCQFFSVNMHNKVSWEAPRQGWWWGTDVQVIVFHNQ